MCCTDVQDQEVEKNNKTSSMMMMTTVVVITLEVKLVMATMMIVRTRW